MRESEWMHVYRMGPKHTHHLSKFLTGEVKVSLSSLREKWFSFTVEEQLEFARAIEAKRNYTVEEQDILYFLMEAGSELVWPHIALALPHCADRERVLHFLIERISVPKSYCSSFYQALRLVGDSRAIPHLLRRYEEYKRAIQTGGPQELIVEYLECCRALWKLTGSEEYEAAVKEMLTHSDEYVRRRAQLALSE